MLKEQDCNFSDFSGLFFSLFVQITFVFAETAGDEQSTRLYSSLRGRWWCQSGGGVLCLSRLVKQAKLCESNLSGHSLDGPVWDCLKITLFDDLAETGQAYAEQGHKCPWFMPNIYQNMQYIALYIQLNSSISQELLPTVLLSFWWRLLLSQLRCMTPLSIYVALSCRLPEII